MDQPNYAQMQAALEKWGPVSATPMTELQALFQPYEVSKGSHLAQPGSVLKNVFFVSQGLLRFYTAGPDGKEWNKGFARENDLIGSFTSQSPDWPVPYGLQALEPSMLLRAPEQDFQAILVRHSDLAHLIQGYVEALLAQKGRRVQTFQQYDAATRYLDFLAQQPDLAQRLPQYHIASYLGISEVSLSRICGNLARNPS